jgi:hypothetical protein
VSNYIIKHGFLGLQTKNLGAQVGQFFCLPEEPEKICLSLSSEKYAKEAICNLKNWIAAYEFPQLNTNIVV